MKNYKMYPAYLAAAVWLVAVAAIPYVLARNIGAAIGNTWANWRYGVVLVEPGVNEASDTRLCELKDVYCPELEPNEYEVVAHITRAAEHANFNLSKALAIAYCESKYRYNVRNPKSTAKGVYQWLDGTWTSVAPAGTDPITDWRLNIDLFFKHYPIHPEWWSECNNIKL